MTDITPKYPIPSSAEVPGGILDVSSDPTITTPMGTMVSPTKSTSVGGMQAGATTLSQGSGNDVFRISSLGIQLGGANFTDAPFSVDMTGSIKANKGTFGGTLSAPDGVIGGFTINATDISTGTFNTLNKLYFGSSGLSLSNVFKVTSAGALTVSSGVIGGFTITATELYGGIIKTAATVGAGTTGVIIDTAGLRGYDSVLGNTFNLPTDGSAPTFASGIINYTTFNVNTNAVIRTSATVGDGTADSAGILINNTGLYACEVNQTLANANVKILIDGSAVYRGQVEIGSPTGARVDISGNDINLYDDSTGGGGTITGDTASIVYKRTDASAGQFLIQKRASKNNDLGNVAEFFYDAAAMAEKNYLFLGRSGLGALGSTNYTDLTVLHGVQDVRAEINRINDYISRPPLYISDYNKIDGSKQGVISIIAGEGKDGYAGLGFLSNWLVFSDSPSFSVGDTITGNATGATALITYKINANNYLVNHTYYGVNFNGATDNACTTNGVGGGSGTGNLASYTTPILPIIYIDDNLNINIGNHILPDTDNAYDIGSSTGTPASSFSIKDIFSRTHKFSGATSGVITLSPVAVAGTNAITIPAKTGTMALTSDIPASTITTVQFYTASDTWTKPAGAIAVEVICVGSGGGGGSGRRGLATTFRKGGAGGGGGAVTRILLRAADLGTTETITVGVGGTGGAYVNTTSTNGNAGGNGGNSSFGTWLTAGGGGGGAGGDNAVAEKYGGGGGGVMTSSNLNNGGTPAAAVTADGISGQSVFSNTGSGGLNGLNSEWGGASGAGANYASAKVGGSSIYAGAGGGGGGGINFTDIAYAGGAGGLVQSYTAGGGAAGGAAGGQNNGTNGSANTVNKTGYGGGGGGGGGSAGAGTASGQGGDGGLPGGGGGGGGASIDNAGNALAGGNGGGGLVKVITYY